MGERTEVVKRGEVALNELRLSVSTRADEARIDRVRLAMLALDGEQADAKSARDALVEALEKLSRQVERHVESCRVWLPDHACAECVPGGEILVPGFRCGRHAAPAALKLAKS